MKIPENLTLGKIPREKKHQLADLYTGGMLVFDLLILQSLFASAPTDKATYTALFACVIAIPALCGATISKLVYEHTKRSYAILNITGSISTCTCTCALLWHISPPAMWVFIFTIIISSNIITRMK